MKAANPETEGKNFFVYDRTACPARIERDKQTNRAALLMACRTFFMDVVWLIRKPQIEYLGATVSFNPSCQYPPLPYSLECASNHVLPARERKWSAALYQRSKVIIVMALRQRRVSLVQLPTLPLRVPRVPTTCLKIANGISHQLSAEHEYSYTI